MPWMVWTWINPIIVLVLLSLLTLAVLSRCEVVTDNNTSIHLQENGYVSWCQSSDGEGQRDDTSVEGILTPASTLTYWGLYLKVAVAKNQQGVHVERWVLKNECSEANYRRLARVILAVQRKTNNGAN